MARSIDTIQTIPITGRIVASVVTMSVAVVLLTVALVHRITRFQFSFAVTTIKQTLCIVTFFVADAVGKHVPASDRRRAITPWIDA